MDGREWRGHRRAGYILTGPDLLVDGRRRPEWPLGRDPLALEASTPGVFVAGDPRHGSTKRVAGAVGEGAMATALVHRRLAELDGISLVKGAPSISQLDRAARVR